MHSLRRWLIGIAVALAASSAAVVDVKAQDYGAAGELRPLPSVMPDLGNPQLNAPAAVNYVDDVPQWQTPHVETGFDNGFFIASPDGVRLGDTNVPFLLKNKGIFQFRHTLMNSDNAALLDRNDLELERARLMFTGFLYSPHLSYTVTIEGDTDVGGGVARALDYFIEYMFSEPLGWDHRVGFKLGQWKSPFGRQWIEPFWRLQFADRSLATVFTLPNRNVGAGLVGSGNCWGMPYSWTAVITNGFDTLGMPAETLDNNLGYLGHVWFDLLERSPDAPDPWSDGEPDLAWTEEPAMRVGFSWFYTQIEATAAGEFVRPRTVDRGATVASLVLPLGVTQFSLAQQGIDVGYKFRGLSVWSEYFFRQIDDYRGAALSDLFDHGMYVQAGYFIVPKHLELAARYSVLWGNSGTLGASYAESSEIAAGFTYYIRGHYIKLVSDITLLDGAPINNPTPNIRAGEDGVLWRSQFQLAW